MDAWSRNAVRGAAAGLIGYAITFPAALWLGPKLAPSCAKLSKRERLEWAAYIPSTINASVIAVAASRHIMNRTVRERRAHSTLSCEGHVSAADEHSWL
jgi:hypothetical protein